MGVVVDFMCFVSGGSGGFFSRWCWVSCGKGGGDGWLKERDSEEKINRVREREREIVLYYFILLGSIYYFNELSRKIKVRMLSVV